MKKLFCSILSALSVAIIAGVAAPVASAQLQVQQQADVFSTNYFSNNTTPGAPAATLRFTEQQSQSVEGVNPATDYLEECAMIYVYAADQQLAECCGCPVSQNGLVHENVQKDLLGNTLTRVVPNEGVIQIVSGLYVSSNVTGDCDPTNFVVAPEINSWVTHVQNKVGTGFPITETRGDEELLSSTELGNLQADCAYARKLGSGFGVCTCNTEAVK